MAAQLTAMKGLSLRGLLWWMARATSSLPVPLSPWMRTVASGRRHVLDQLIDHLHLGVLADHAAEFGRRLDTGPQIPDFLLVQHRPAQRAGGLLQDQLDHFELLRHAGALGRAADDHRPQKLLLVMKRQNRQPAGGLHLQRERNTRQAVLRDEADPGQCGRAAWAMPAAEAGSGRVPFSDVTKASSARLLKTTSAMFRHSMMDLKARIRQALTSLKPGNAAISWVIESEVRSRSWARSSSWFFFSSCRLEFQGGRCNPSAARACC